MRRRSVLPALVGAAALASMSAAPRVARANPMDTFGFGSRCAAMASACAADVRDFSASYYNPAGLALARRLDASVGYFYADHGLSMNGRRNAVDPVRGLVGGIVAPGAILGVPFAFGVALHLPDDRLSRVRALPQEVPRWELYDNRNQRLFLAANLAVSPWRWLQIGGGLSFMSSTDGRLDITGGANLFDPTSSQLRHEVDASLGAVRYPQLGARVELSEEVAFAVVYRGEFKLDLDLRARLYGDVSALTTAYYALRAVSVSAYLPQQLVWATSYRFGPRVKANVDLTWMNYRRYVSPVANLDVVLDIPPPPGGWPAGITPPTTPAPTKVAPLDVADRVVPHVGVEVRVLEGKRVSIDVRGGWEFMKSPFAEQTGVTNFVDRDRHMFSSGVGFEWRPPWEFMPRSLRLDVHGQVHWLVDGTTRKADPSSYVGDYTAGGTIANLGGTLGIGF
jgi:long-chain fatty acid transport protein